MKIAAKKNMMAQAVWATTRRIVTVVAAAGFAAFGATGRFLYLPLRGPGAVAALRVEDNASLTPLGITAGALPVNDGASGLAAY